MKRRALLDPANLTSAVTGAAEQSSSNLFGVNDSGGSGNGTGGLNHRTNAATLGGGVGMNSVINEMEANKVSSSSPTAFGSLISMFGITSLFRFSVLPFDKTPYPRTLGPPVLLKSTI